MYILIKKKKIMFDKNILDLCLIRLGFKLRICVFFFFLCHFQTQFFDNSNKFRLLQIDGLK